MRTLPIIAAWCCAALAGAAEIHVAADGDDAATGTADAPLASIQLAVDRAGAGDSVVLHAGTYRQSVVVHRGGTVDAPLTLRALAGANATICGSRVASGWQPAGAAWRTAWSAPSQTAFVDGAPLAQIGPVPAHYGGIAADGSWMLRAVGAGPADLVPGSFCVADGALYVRLADGGDPRAHLVEASTAPRLVTFDDGAAHVRIAGLRFRHSNTSALAQIGGAIELGDDCWLSDCDVQWCDFAGIALAWHHGGGRVIRCVSSNNGDCGIQATTHAGLLIQDAVCAGNNWRGFNAQWHAGGVKITADSAGRVERVEAHHNHGNGIWFDWCSNGGASVVHACRVHDNAAPGEGLIAEASAHIRFVDNVLQRNERRGVYISASDDIDVVANTIVGTTGFAAIDVAGMPRPGRTLRHVRVRDNLVANNTAQADLRIVRENGGDIVDLVADHNLFWRDADSPRLWWGADARGGWAGTTWYSVADFAAATPFGTGCVQSAPRFAGGDCQLAVGSPAIDAGSDVGATDDALGRARPVGGAPDIGAFEYGAATPPGGGDSGGSGGTSGGGDSSGAAPTFAHAPAATTSAGSRTLQLSARAADPLGEAAIVYRWEQIAGPTTLTFVRNGDNAAKRTAAIATAAGDYRLRVTATDAAGRSAAAEVAATIAARATALALTPTAAWLRPDESGDFAATALDQFVAPLAPQPAIAWTATDGVAVRDGAVAAGGSSRVVTASAAGLTAHAPIAVAATFAAAIDFGPAEAAVADGCVRDSGAAFATHAGGLAFGWDAPNATTRDRATGANRRDDTLIHLQRGGADARWKLAVPDGTYHVRACCGDAARSEGRYQLTVGGVVAVDAAPDATHRWAIGVVEVEVRGGFLVVGNGPRAVDNKLCWIEIAGVPSGPG